MKTCNKCILPESFPGISFDDSGICNFCQEYEPEEKPLGKEKLLEVLNSEERKGEYDCVVPLSGGKDSTFVLYYAVKELNLKPIAVSYDSGFQSELARENIRTTCEILDIPLIIHRSKRNLREKMFKQALLISYKIGFFDGPGCGNCGIMLITSALNTAIDHNVPFILWGTATFEVYIAKKESRRMRRHESTSPGTVARHITRFKELRAEKVGYLEMGRRVLLKFKNIWFHHRPKMVYKNLNFLIFLQILPNLMMYSWLSVRQRLAMKVPLKYALHPFMNMDYPQKRIRTIFFYNYIGYDYTEQIEVMGNELNWKHPENIESRFDCLIHQIGNFKSLDANDISQDGVTFANLVRQDLITRDEALLKEDEIRKTAQQACIDLIDRVGLRPKKLLKIKKRLNLIPH